MSGDHPDGAPVRDEGGDAGDDLLGRPVVDDPGGPVAGQLGAGPVVLGHLEPDPGEGVGRGHLESVTGGAAVAGVVGVCHQEGGGRPVEEDDLVELEHVQFTIWRVEVGSYHERSALQQPVLQLTVEETAPTVEDEGPVALLQLQLLQEVLALGLRGHEDLCLNRESWKEVREERGETRGKSLAQLEQPSQCWRLGAMMAETVVPSLAMEKISFPVAGAGLWSTRLPSSSLITVVVVSMSKLDTVFSFTLSM